MHASLGLAALFAIALLTGWPLIRGLSTGTIYSKRVGYSRAKDPSSFWFYAGCYGIAFIASTGLLLFFAVTAAIGGEP